MTRVAMPFHTAACSVLAPGFGTNGQNTRRPHTASRGGSAKSTAPSAISRPTAEEMPRPRVPGITASASVSSARTTVMFDATIAGTVLRQAVLSARR